MVTGKRLPLGLAKIYNVILFLLPRKKNPSRIKPNLICKAERQNASFVLILKHRNSFELCPGSPQLGSHRIRGIRKKRRKRKKKSKLKKSWLPSCSRGRRPCDLTSIAVALSTVCDHTAVPFEVISLELPLAPRPSPQPC